MQQARVTELLTENGAVKGIKTENGECIFADSVILATGGKSYPKTGSTGDGYALAQSVGHTVTPLFTHFGVSGPMILSASAHMREMQAERYTIDVDLKPALSHEKLDARVLRDFSENLNKSIANTLGLLLPRAIIPAVLRLSGLRPSEKVNQITKEQRGRLVETVKALRLTVMDFHDIKEAIVTAGGVKTGEVNPKTMESKLCRGLYFAGELLDCDGYTGGFNLQIAFSTGRLAGVSAGE